MRVILLADGSSAHPILVLTSAEAKVMLATPGFQVGTMDTDLFLNDRYVSEGFEVRVEDEAAPPPVP